MAAGRKFILLACNMDDDGSLSGFVGLKKSYLFIHADPEGTVIKHEYPKKDYRSFDHFVGIMGKFLPWWFFYRRPEPLKSLKYDDVHDAFDKATARAAGHDFVMSEGPVTKAYGEKKGQG